MNRFEGKKVLITGGTKGLGFATAQLFAEEGATLYLSYRSDTEAAQKAQHTLQKTANNCHLFQCDLAENSGIDHLFNQVSEVTQDLDFYIHNAAATAFKPLLNIESHHIDKTFNITVKSFILGIKRASQMMPRNSAIVSVSGMDTTKAVPKHGLLGGAKSALETLTAYAAHELAPMGIRANSINPGFFESESTRKYLGPAFEMIHEQTRLLSPLRKCASLEDIAKVILFLCSLDSHWIVGQTIQVDGGFDFALPMPSMPARV